jgi:hypothetical protein
MVAEDDDQNRIGFHLEEIVVSYITNQWVKMNPFEAAARLNELERENAAMRATSRGKEKAKVEKLERENAVLRSALTTLLAWEDKGGDIPPTAARGLFRIARAALDSARKEAQP